MIIPEIALQGDITLTEEEITTGPLVANTPTGELIGTEPDYDTVPTGGSSEHNEESVVS